MKRIYFDYAATTPLDSSVLRAMNPYFKEKFGNDGSLHSFGQAALAGIDAAREKIATALGLDILTGFREIIFTGSATEANNLALRATAREFRIRNPKSEIPRLIISAIEHESILETARDLEKKGIELVILPVDKKGHVDLKYLKNNLTENTALVSIMIANNEIGTIQPIKEISLIIKDFRGSKKFPLFHSDAVQAFQYLDCSPEKLDVDLLTLSAHKICGPKGVGALYVRSGIFPKSLPIIFGGGQEFGWRSGTENPALIVGFRKAIEMAAAIREKEKIRVAGLRNMFWRELKKIYPAAVLNNDFSSKGNSFLPNVLNVYFPDYSAEELVIKFDLAGMAVSAGSACSARAAKDSHVLAALGWPANRIKSSLRFSFGRLTTSQEIKEGAKIMKGILKS